MAKRFRSERLSEPFQTVSKEIMSTCRITMHKLYKICRVRNIARYNPELDYADFVHGLWSAILKHPELTGDANRIKGYLGEGDTVQLLSDVISEHRANSSNS